MNKALLVTIFVVLRCVTSHAATFVGQTTFGAYTTSIQHRVDSKAPIEDPYFEGTINAETIQTGYLTTGDMHITNLYPDGVSGNPLVTALQLSYLADLTGGVQTNLGLKAPLLYPVFESDLQIGVGASALKIGKGHGSIASNTAMGVNSLSGASNTGTSNTAYGSYSLNGNTSGTGNTAIGASSGLATTTGSNNTFIGYMSGHNDLENFSNTTVVGANAVATKDNQVVLGDYNVVETQLTGKVLMSSADVSQTLTASKFVSTVSTGTAPFTVTSQTPVANLSIGGIAATAKAFDVAPTLCTGGQVPTGILVSGNATGCFAPTGTTDHLLLSNIGTNTHTQIDTALARLINTSGNNTGDQDLSGLLAKTDSIWLGTSLVPLNRSSGSLTLVNVTATNANYVTVNTAPSGAIMPLAFFLDSTTTPAVVQSSSLLTLSNSSSPITLKLNSTISKAANFTVGSGATGLGAQVVIDGATGSANGAALILRNAGATSGAFGTTNSMIASTDQTPVLYAPSTYGLNFVVNGTTATPAMKLLSGGTLVVALDTTATAVTQAINDNSTKPATDAFVLGQAGTTTPAADGIAAVGTSLTYARADHVHPSSSGIGAIYRTTSDYTNATTTPSNITGLSWSAAASTDYAFRCTIHYMNTATSAVRLNINGPASPTRVSFKARYQTTSATAEVIYAGTAFSAAAQTAAVTSGNATTAGVLLLEGIIQNGTTAGTVQLMGTASTAAQTNTVYKGSFCEVY
jgi:hypothetical protein